MTERGRGRAAVAVDALSGFHVDDARVGFVGYGLQRPACILVDDDGVLWVPDHRGGIVQIRRDGTQTFVARQGSPIDGSIPNGIAFAENGDLVVADFGRGVVEVMTRQGRCRRLYDAVDGRPLGLVNFVVHDASGRLWFTVSTTRNDWFEAMRPDVADGYIAMADDRGVRIVADGLRFPNELRFDRREEFVYVAETTGRRITRMRHRSDGSLGPRETFGPSDLGIGGFPDGLAFDAAGNLWVAVIIGERLIAITPDGDVRTLWDLGNPAAIKDMERHFSKGGLSQDHLRATRNPIVPGIACLAFGGTDGRTVYVGSLGGSRLACFESPIAGLRR